VAVHCVTEAELVFALAAFREAGTRPGDRIEHASVTPPALLGQLAELRLTVVTQPNFVAERGDAYLAELPTCEHDWLYRCRSFLQHDIPLAGGTDAPFGNADPWAAMHAATHRQTQSGQPLGSGEALAPEQALALFLGHPETPAQPRKITTGAVADLCLLDRTWSEARGSLSSDHVRATLGDGELIFDRVDEPPR
jgi:predicted amidohydrolase YtcJ